MPRAVAQLPAEHRRHLLIRADGDGANHEQLDRLTAQSQVRGRQVEDPLGFPAKNNAVTAAITRLPERVWTAALAAPGGVRDRAEVTGLLDLSLGSAGMRVIVRRERPHPCGRTP
jgi:hypothetical protein